MTDDSSMVRIFLQWHPNHRKYSHANGSTASPTTTTWGTSSFLNWNCELNHLYSFEAQKNSSHAPHIELSSNQFFCFVSWDLYVLFTTKFNIFVSCFCDSSWPSRQSVLCLFLSVSVFLILLDQCICIQLKFLWKMGLNLECRFKEVCNCGSRHKASIYNPFWRKQRKLLQDIHPHLQGWKLHMQNLQS